jgi:hypothetical protein
LANYPKLQVHVHTLARTCSLSRNDTASLSSAGRWRRCACWLDVRPGAIDSNNHSLRSKFAIDAGVATLNRKRRMQGDWWLEEHGLIMEKPSFPLPAGKYMVTGDREITTELTITPDNKWSLKQG